MGRSADLLACDITLPRDRFKTILSCQFLLKTPRAMAEGNAGGRLSVDRMVDRELQALKAVGNNWTVNGQELGSDGSGSEDGEMDVGRGSLEEWKVVQRKRKNKDRDESDNSDIGKGIKTVKRSEVEIKVFIKLLQEGTTFDDWSPIQLTKSLHKEIGEIGPISGGHFLRRNFCETEMFRTFGTFHVCECV